MAKATVIVSSKTIKVEIAPDAIERYTKVSPEAAIEELLWNAIDAEASNIVVSFHENEIEGIERIVVSDDGHGFSEVDAMSVFGTIGASPKRTLRHSPKMRRPYHGKEGRGRYRALSLGDHVVWCSRSLHNGVVGEVSVRINAAAVNAAVISGPKIVAGQPGCDVTVTDVKKSADSLREDARRDAIACRLAPYLMGHPAIQITFDGEPLDISKTVTRDEVLAVASTQSPTSPSFDFQLRVLEWSTHRKQLMYLCDQHGVALDDSPLDVKKGNLNLTAYVMCERLPVLADQGRLGLSELDPEVAAIKLPALERLKEYVRQRHAEEARRYADQIRKEGVYPYAHMPTTPVELAEQQVFDICAATMHDLLPSFDKADKLSRRFAFRILREALESNPSSITKIFSEVLKLSGEQQDDFVRLLEQTSLGAIIQASKTVTERLKFISGLEQVLHEKDKRVHLKERTQLHRMLVDELWLFGDEYSLGADDVSLKKVLDQHREIIGLPSLDKQLPTSGVAGLSDIPDLLLWRQYLRGRADQYEHLVIELKRPTVKISLTEIAQVKRYANAILGNRYFDKEKTHWTFMALSDEVAKDAEEDVRPRDRQYGHVHVGKQHDIWVKTWAEVIQSAKARLEWMKKQLNMAVAGDLEGLEYLRSKYSHLFSEELVNVKSQEGADGCRDECPSPVGGVVSEGCGQ